MYKKGRPAVSVRTFCTFVREFSPPAPAANQIQTWHRRTWQFCELDRERSELVEALRMHGEVLTRAGQIECY